MANLYALAIEYPDGTIAIAQDDENKQVVAHEGKQYLLREIGDRHLESGVITAYQLIMMVGGAKRKVEDVSS
jgi:hypothetical protein